MGPDRYDVNGDRLGRAPRRGRHAARALAVATALLAACAGAPAAGPDRAPPFQAVRTVILVREAPAREKRPRDPLDGLEQSLVERGIATRTVELGPGLRGDLREVDRLAGRVKYRALDAPARATAYRPTQELGPDAGRLLERLGADAFAIYVRFDDRYEDPFRTPGVPRRYPGDPAPGPLDPYPRSRPAAALALVDRGGTLLTLDWGEAGVDAGVDPRPSRFVNAAEAVDEAVRVLTGGPEREEDAL